MNESANKMVIAEKIAAATYPVYDYRLLTDQYSPFRLYDCLKPVLFENLKKPIEIYENYTHAEDIKLKIQLRNVELQIKETQADHLR